MWDAAVVGGGMYGATIACYLKEQRGFGRVTLLEREPGLMRRASWRNQGRIHMGYHYPRSWTTAVRSRINVQRFLREHPRIVREDVASLYGIARANSKTNARQFVRFCREIGANLAEAPPAVAALFDSEQVEAVFRVEESMMDLPALVRSVTAGLDRAGVSVQLGRDVRTLVAAPGGGVDIGFGEGSAPTHARYVFNCTYSGLATLSGPRAPPAAGLTHEIAEMAVVRAAPEFQGLALTLMDGPFFSLMPHATPGTHTLSHVRHTPHVSWSENGEQLPYARLDAYPKESRFERMIRAAARFVPGLRGARHVDSIFEVKTVLHNNEIDDGRPILFERNTPVPGCYSILGGKIDNVYDALDRLDAEPLPLGWPPGEGRQ